MNSASSNMQKLINEISVYTDRYDKGDQILHTEFEGVDIMRVREPMAKENHLLTPLMCLVLQGKKATTYGDNVVSYGNGDALIVSVDTPVVAQIIEASPEKPYVSIKIDLDFDIVQSLTSEIQYGDDASEEAAEAITAGKCSPELIDAVARLFRLADEDPVSRKVMAPMILREIHYRLLFEGHAGMLRRLTRPNSRAANIKKALIKLKTHYAENLVVAELAETAGMSVSGFHSHFKEVTGTTPLQYQKELRLLQAKAILTTTSKSVSSIAHEVGYDSTTQFSREYSRKFGKSPSRDRDSVLA